ncbi:MAG: ISAs1 family transposase [Candidatus Roizmanbacteria bacterium]|nr:ISAs1 family transposase [Candidatus Roizmanbacteria bacterium]
MKDHRIDRKKLHLLEDIVFITIAAVISGAASWNEIELFGKHKKDWLASFLSLPNGIPSHDTFNRFFASLDPEVFEQVFTSWVNSLVEKYPGDIIAIDGKTIRGSKGKGFHSATHVVSAFSIHNQLIMGQLQVDQKSNEITAIPKLLDALLINGSVVTIDAMGCQKEIAKKIRSRQADYVLMVKENQSELLDDIKDSFKMLEHDDYTESLDFGHGRIETRKCAVITDLSLIEKPTLWKSLTSIVRVESERYIKSTGVTQSETRYYISSLCADANQLLHAIRSHWGIENNAHWSLDVAFNEDSSRKRARNAAMNFSIINRLALNMIKKEESKMGLKAKRLLAGWSQEYILKVLKF